MDGQDQKKIDRAMADEFPTESTWHLGTAAESDNVYFFGSDRDTATLLGDFGWDLHHHLDAAEDGGGHPARIVPVHDGGGGGGDNLAGSSGMDDHKGGIIAVSGRGLAEPDSAAQRGGPAASSSSSDDPPEKSTASADNGGGGVSVSKPSPDTPSNSKGKKKGQKRVRQPRFAFMTKSEVDHLEDGYRWRKYGQKAVKNSPFPRSYYRCTNSKCMVKKRVERSCEDPTIVITTYEGQHCHHTIGFPRASSSFINTHHLDHIYHHVPFSNRLLTPSSSSSSSLMMRYPYPSEGVLFPHPSPGDLQQQHQVGGAFTSSPDALPEAPPRPRPPADEGLLGDIVPGMQQRER